MSRHRHVRNLNYDDYDDGYDDDYDNYSEEEEQYDEDTARYMLNSGHQQNSETNFISAQQEQERVIHELCEQFNSALSASFTFNDVERALVQSDFNQDVAFDYLRAKLPQPSSNNQPNAHDPLILDTPSAIGRAATQHSESPAFAHSSTSLGNPSVSLPTDFVVGSGRALYPDESHVERFRFETQSPDDVILEKRGRGQKRAEGARLKLPKPSSRKPSQLIVPPVPASTVQPASTSASNGQPSSSSPVGKQSEASSVSSNATRKKANGVKAKKLRIPKKTESRVPKSMQQAGNLKDGNAPSPNEGPSKSQAGQVQRLKAVDVQAAAKEALFEKSSLSVVVAGHVDAGKSTLLGQLLKRLEDANSAAQRRKGRSKSKTRGNLAWITDQDAVEREHGVTIDFCTRQFDVERNGKITSFAMLDAPGHRDFVPAMIAGATQASAAVLVVDGSHGEFEKGISEEGQTREHAVLLRAVGISNLLVVVNKLDTVDYDKSRYDDVVLQMKSFLKFNGWRNPASFVPVSGRVGINVTSSPSSECELSKWYKGPTFLDGLFHIAGILEKETEKRTSEEPQKATRFLVSDSYRCTRLGGVKAVTGRLLRGTLAARDTLVVCPGGQLATVKHIEVDNERVKLAIAGVHNTPVNLSITGITDSLEIKAGYVLSDPVDVVPMVTRFAAQIVVRNPLVPLFEGSAVEVHVGGGCEAGRLHKLAELCGKGKTKIRPRRLVKGEAAIVHVEVDREICLEKSKDLKHLGFLTLRSQGRSVALGIVLDILKTKKLSKDNAEGQHPPTQGS